MSPSQSSQDLEEPGAGGSGPDPEASEEVPFSLLPALLSLPCFLDVLLHLLSCYEMELWAT